MKARFGLISIGVHAVLLASLLIVLRGRHGDPELPDQMSRVELVMEQQKGDNPTSVPPAPQSTQPEEQPEVETEAPQPPPPVQSAELAEPLPTPPAPPTPPQEPKPRQVARSAAKPTPPAPPQPPVISLSGGAGETNAIAMGDDIIPAGVDAKYRNREPDYPPEARRRGQQGSVVLLIRVSPNGMPENVEVVRSSGYPLLDRTARETVATWHFVPAVRNGMPITFDMPFNIVFQLK